MWRPSEETPVLIGFENGFYLAYIAPRKLGRISLADNPRELVEEQELAPDALVPVHDDGIISQFEGFEDLEEFD